MFAAKQRCEQLPIAMSARASSKGRSGAGRGGCPQQQQHNNNKALQSTQMRQLSWLHRAAHHFKWVALELEAARTARATRATRAAAAAAALLQSILAQLRVCVCVFVCVMSFFVSFTPDASHFYWYFLTLTGAYHVCCHPNSLTRCELIHVYID